MRRKIKKRKFEHFSKLKEVTLKNEGVCKFLEFATRLMTAYLNYLCLIKLQSVAQTIVSNGMMNSEERGEKNVQS
jgi:hypothetical protein